MLDNIRWLRNALTKIIDNSPESKGPIGISFTREYSNDFINEFDSVEERLSIMQESMEALEKRNEPIEPIKPEELWICGACNEGIVGWDDWIIGDTRNNYCPNCGQAVKWHDND